MQSKGKFLNPSLFIVGSKSDYFEAGDEKVIEEYFPSAAIEVLDTGHWVQAEKPKEFAEAVMKFLQSPV